MELSTRVGRLENKVASERELGRYFGTKSTDDLLLTLRRLARDGYFKFVVMLSAEYFDWERAHQDVLLRADVLKPVDPFGALQRSAYGLSVSGGVPLSEKEIIEVIRKLPPSMVERYLRFKLSGINQDKLSGLIAAQHKARGADEDEYYDRVEYNGLAVDGPEVTYNGEIISMGFQHRQVVRLLLQKQGRLCTKDDFTDEYAEIFTRNSYPDVYATLRKLIAEVHRELRAIIKSDCIVSKPGDGWYLKIEP